MNISGKSRTGYKGALAVLLAALLAALLIGLPAAADDTELYFGKLTSTRPPPLVMLTLDYRPNVANAKVCGDEASCRTFMGDEIFAELDPVALASGNVTLFDSFQAVFKLVFKSDAFDGMKIGFMMSHANCTGGVCGSESNGGYVLRGFELFEPGLGVGGDANKAKQELLDIFGGLPRDVSGNTHPYQGLEIFFEMYRYLTGLDVLNGHKGFADFDSTSTDRNLDHEFAVGGSGSGTDAGPPVCLFTTGGITGDNRACAGYVGAGAAYSINADSNYREVNKVAGSCPAGTTLIGSKCYTRISSALTWDQSIERPDVTPARYTDPFEDGDWSCSGVYSINMLFQVSGNDADSNTEIAKSLALQGLDYSPPSGANGFPSIIDKLHTMDIRQGQAGTPIIAGQQNLTSYFLVDKQDTKTDNYSVRGGTGPNAIPAMSDPRKLLAALKDIGNQINSVSSSYVAVTVPVNADNRVTSLPNLFLALFQVDENGKPYWPGNLKKLDILTTTDATTGAKTIAVNDALGAAAFNPITGRLKDSALTLWTDPSGTPSAVDKYFPADTTKGEMLGRDGSSVRRGGAGHKIPNYIAGTGVGETNATGTRQIFLERASVIGTVAAGTPMVPLDATSGSTLLADVAIQDLLGIHDTSGTGTCPGRDVDNYCVTFIDEVLTLAGQATTPAPPSAQTTKARTATQLFLRWIRGFDVFNEGAVTPGPPWDGLTTTAQRKWLMGDVLHSRPLAVNYGARGGYGTDNQDVRLIFGSNDGLLRMVRNTASGTTKPSADTQEGAAYGQEVWAFMPRELLAHVPELAKNFGNVGLNRPYGADGPPTLFTIDTNGDGIIDNAGSTCTVGADDCDRAWIYFGLRRGGKSYYAVDISNPDATIPNLLWKINEGTTGFTELGMTFSSPRVGWVRFEDVSGLNLFGTPSANVPVPVVIFGGGYHGHAVTSGDHHNSGIGGPSKDTILGTPFTGADTDEGNAIFIVHARTGQLIWKVTGGSGTVSATESFHATMEHGFAAAVSPMDADGDGILDRLYVADTGGRVWRVDIPEFIPPSTPAPPCLAAPDPLVPTTKFSTCDHRARTWKATVLADLRPADLAATPDDDLRFFHGATLVRRARDGIGVYDAVYLGSGDREHPQSETNKNNWFFLLKDRRITSGDTTSFTAYRPSGLKDVTNACFATSSSPTCSDTELAMGWRLALEETGEKNLSEPFIGGEGVIFTTYLPLGVGPDDAQCVPLGTSRLYQVALDTGAPLPFLHHDGEVSPTLIKDDRYIELYSGIDGGVVAVSPDFWITSTGKSGKNPPQKPIQFYWRESGVDEVK